MSEIRKSLLLLYCIRNPEQERLFDVHQPVSFHTSSCTEGSDQSITLAFWLSHYRISLLGDEESPTMGVPLTIAALLLASLVAFWVSFLYTKQRKRRSPGPVTESAPSQLETATDTPLLPVNSPEFVEETEKRENGKRKKRGRKKRTEIRLECGKDVGGCRLSEERKEGDGKADVFYPFSTYANAIQRKIKLQYDELVKSNQAKALTMTQVRQFANCLMDARNELQHKSEILQRSFKIKKALLFKADRSSFDRLCQQIYKLEAEHRRLEEGAAVYNLFQEQLKLSPAYKKMVEIGASLELKDDVDEAMEFSEISFEELLAQEKRDSFWQRNGKLRSVTS